MVGLGAPATPSRSASSSTVGRSSTRRPRAARPAAARPRRRPPSSSSRASPSRSTSSQRDGHAVAGQEVAQVVRARGEKRWPITRTPPDSSAAPDLPRRQQVLDDRVELLLGRVPGLEQVVVEVDLVDRLDRRLGVGVGGEQHALGLGRRARAPRRGTRSPTCRACAGRRPAARPASPRARSSRSASSASLAGGGAQDPVALAEPAPQVARDGGEHGRLVVDGDDRRPPRPRAALLLLRSIGRAGNRHPRRR